MFSTYFADSFSDLSHILFLTNHFSYSSFDHIYNSSISPHTCHPTPSTSLQTVPTLLRVLRTKVTCIVGKLTLHQLGKSSRCCTFDCICLMYFVFVWYDCV